MWHNYKTDIDVAGRNKQVAGSCRKFNHEEEYYIPLFLINKKNAIDCARSRYRPDENE